METVEKKKRKHVWIPILNTILVIIVVFAMLMMVVSELVLDKDVALFGYSMQTGPLQSLLIVRDGLCALEIPHGAWAAENINSVPGYIAVVFLPCVLLVVIQVIASSLDRKENEGEKPEAEKSVGEKKAEQPQPKRPAQEAEHAYRPVYTQAQQTAPMPNVPPVQEQEPPQVENLMQENLQLKAALQQSQNQNEELRIRAVQAIKKAREQQVPTYPNPAFMQMPYPPQYPVYPPQQAPFYPPQLPPQYPVYPPQQMPIYPTYPPQYPVYPPQQGPMQ